MDELLKQALAAGVRPKEFFTKWAPKLHAARGADFDRLSEVGLIFSVHLTDTGERYTVHLEPDGQMEVEEGELDDFPLATLEATAGDWAHVSARLLTLAQAADLRRAELERAIAKKMSQKIHDDLEKIDGVIEVEIEDGAKTLSWRVILNHYEAQDGAPTFRIKVPAALIEDVVHGRKGLGAALKEAKLSGDTKFALSLAGFFTKNFA